MLLTVRVCDYAGGAGRIQAGRAGRSGRHLVAARVPGLEALVVRYISGAP
jgi:hypothetical protein